MWSLPLNQTPLLPPTTLLIGVDSRLLGMALPGMEGYVVCALWFCGLFSLSLAVQTTILSTPKYPSPTAIFVCACLCFVRAQYLNTHTISLRILAPIRPIYSLCEPALLYPFSCLFIRSCFSAFYIASIRNYYCCMFVSASTAVPMHTCQPYP